MIHALGYEPKGQRQRFEPREQQEQDRHIHLHIHLNLTFRARQKRSAPTPDAVRLTRILAALVGATAMYFWLFIFLLSIHDGPPDPLLSRGNLAWIMLFAGLACTWVFGCLPLLVSAWRSTSQGRFGFLGLLVLFLSISFFFLLTFVFHAVPPPFGLLISIVLALLFFVHPLISAILLRWVSRETRALREIAPAHAWPGFVVVSGMVITLLGGLILNLSAMLGGHPRIVLLCTPAMCGAVIVAIRMFHTAMVTLLRHKQPLASQPRPKDASPSDIGSPGEL